MKILKDINLQEVMKDFYKVRKIIIIVWENSKVGNNFFQGLLYVTILVAGGFFIAEGSLEPVALATYALYINIFITPIEVLVEFTEMLQKGYSGFKRFNEVMETQVEIQDAPRQS